MRVSRYAGGLVIVAAVLVAIGAAPRCHAAAAKSSTKEKLVERLGGEFENAESFEKAVQEAKRGGVSEQVIASARSRYWTNQIKQDFERPEEFEKVAKQASDAGVAAELIAKARLRMWGKRLLGGSFKTMADFEKCAQEALAAQIPPQGVDEARVIAAIEIANGDELRDAVERANNWLNDWQEPRSLAFDDKNELEAVLHAARARIAELTRDMSTYESELKAAFWADPAHAKRFGAMLTALREKERRANLVLPMDLQIQDSTGKVTTLADLARGKRAVLLDFWASWCGPCMSLMSELRQRAARLDGLGVAVAGVNTEGKDDAANREAAERVRKQKGISFAWLVEPSTEPLSKLLGIDSIPTAVLIDSTGRVLFQGHPRDPGLATALAKLGLPSAALTAE